VPPLFTETIVVLRAPTTGRDSQGNVVRDWSAAARTTYRQVSVQPRTSTESRGEPRSRTVTGWRIQSRAGVDIDVVSTDRVEWADKVLEVLGDVDRWPHPIRPGSVHHVEFDVQRVRG
jgi:hypothetical protein